MQYLWLALFGLVVGLLARWVLPSRRDDGIILTILLGIGGSMIGGIVGKELGWGAVTGWNLQSIGLAVLGAVLLIVVVRVLRRL